LTPAPCRREPGVDLNDADPNEAQRSLCRRKCPCDHDAMAARSEAVSGSGPSVLGLRRDAIGLREVLFQSITLMAPGAAIAAAIPAGALYAGGTMPLSVLVALVACLLASCIGLLACELPSAGSLATYTARGLHPAWGS